MSAALLLGASTAWGQNATVGQQAETGTLGADWTTPTAAGVRYVTVTPGPNPSAQTPGTAARVITYSVRFPAPGTYNLYARIRVGAATVNDDSFYYGNGFGVKLVTDDTNWITVNLLSNVGYTAPTDVVGSAGTALDQVWKWINLSAFNGFEPPVIFTVPAGSLTQTFQIGAREDGLDIDKFVFGQVGSTFTVASLDAVVLGTRTGKATAVHISPNPAAGGRFTLSGTGQLSQVRVLDLQGRLVLERPVHQQQTLDVQLPATPGLYVLQLHDAQGFTTSKLVVE
jgi:endo-1,4-beta-xylanase